jgi:L-alanine-DL-glutamate epimerase-like enolase superfamily enzyme
MAAISAVDIALWDAWARHLSVPVHDLLGGRTHADFPVYASRLYATDDLDMLAGEARGYVAAGFTGVKQRLAFGPADGTAGMRRNEELVRVVRAAIGPDVDLMVDVYMGWDLDYARRMLRRLEAFDLRWLEEPLLPDDVRGYAELRSSSCIPIATGEHEFTVLGFAELLRARAVDVIQFDTNRVGGITQAQKVCALAEAAGIPVVPHAGQMHNYHLVASQSACRLAEYFPPGPIDVGNELPQLLFAGEPVAKDGRIRLDVDTGLGLSLDPRPPLTEVRRPSLTL